MSNNIKNKRKIHAGDFRVNEEEKSAVLEVLDSHRITEGEKLREFETLFAEYIGTKYAIGVNSGTSALICGLTALKYHDGYNINNGSKIITTPLTYTATSNAILLSGFEPVYVDIDKDTFCITPDNISELLEGFGDTNQFSLILPVHLLGYPCEMDKINKIAKKYGLKTFEDSAEAIGTTYKGKKVGSMSILSAYSFFIAHNIQVGEMGAVTTDDPELMRLLKKVKANGRMCDCLTCTRMTLGCPKIKSQNYGSDFDPRFKHDLIGYNFKTMDIQASIGITQLNKADWIIKTRYNNVKYYNEGLDDFSDLLQLPRLDKNVSYITYPLVVKEPQKLKVQKLREKLEEKGIETRPLFGSIPTQQPAYSHLKNQYKDKLPVSDYIGENGFYIGCHQYLNHEDLEYVVKTFKKVLK